MDSSSFKTSLGKKLIAVALCVTAFVFLSFSVIGTTYNPTTYNTYTDAITVSNVTYSLRVTQFKALSTGTSMLPSGMETVMFVQFQLCNNNNSDALCQIPQFNIEISDERVITDVYTYAGDLSLGITSSGFIVLPTQAFSYNAQNKIVVPANSTLTLIGGIGLPAQLNQTGDGTIDTGLRGVHLLNKPYTVTLGTYEHGIPVDVSPIIQYIDDLETYLDNVDSNVADIASDTGSILTTITSMASNIAYTGSDPQLNNTQGTYVYVNKQDFSIGNYRTWITRRVSQAIPITYDYEYNSTNDTANAVATYRYYFNITICNINTGNPIVASYYHLYDLFPHSYINLYVNRFESSIYEGFNTGNSYCEFYVKVPYTNSQGVVPTGSMYTFIGGYIDVVGNTTLTWPTIDLSREFHSSTPFRTDQYYPKDEYTILRDLYIAYSKVNGLDDIDDVADEITDKSETAHTQEQTYFTQNAQAIQQTGLNNYRFNTDQENGISSVSHDFVLLWNALGGFNSVYVFSLTLALALMILRHVPGAISTYQSKQRAQEIKDMFKKGKG